ncbi:hypothetical protein WAI453_006477 [Rhynchosporium graminicola]
MLRPAPIETNSSSQADGLNLPRTTLRNHPSNASDNGNSKISLEQWENILKRLGYDHTRSENKTMFNGIKHCDEDAIEIDDFVSALDSKVPDEASDTEIARAFEVFDREKTGKVTPDGLYSVIEILGQRMNKNQLSAIFKEADLDGDGVINYDDFYYLVKCKERRST